MTQSDGELTHSLKRCMIGTEFDGAKDGWREDDGSNDIDGDEEGQLEFDDVSLIILPKEGKIVGDAELKEDGFPVLLAVVGSREGWKLGIDDGSEDEYDVGNIETSKDGENDVA